MKIPGAFLLGTSAALALVFSLTLAFGTFWLSQMRDGTDLSPEVVHQIVPSGASAQEKQLRVMDFQGGMAVHLRISNFLFFTPLLLWAIVFLFDRRALSTRNGKIANWIVLISLLIAFGALLWLRHFVIV